MKDFTTKILIELLNTLSRHDYLFCSVSDYVSYNTTSSRIVLLRHDVEARYKNALKFANIQQNLGIKGTYYFRFSEQSFNESAIHKVVEMGHEIGYHYDDFSLCKGNSEKAIKSFENHLNQLNEIAPIRTICMEGDPLSKFDNRDLWKKYNYGDFGIITEPYIDFDFNDIFYLTDTGRCWDGDRFNVRDKVVVSNKEFKQFRFHSTNDIINAIENEKFPNKIMITFHPQRWSDDNYLWVKELIWQNIKNQIKKLFFVR